MLLKKAGIHHMVSSVATITKCRDIVIVGSGALIAVATRLPADLMMTDEIDLYVRDAADPDDVQQLIEGTLGEGTYFQKTFRYHVDAVSAHTAVLPADWQTRASRIRMIADPEVTVTCPSVDDIAVSKCVAWREKDKAWLELCAHHGLVDLVRMRELAIRIDAADLGDFAVADILLRIDFLSARPTGVGPI